MSGLKKTLKLGPVELGVAVVIVGLVALLVWNIMDLNRKITISYDNAQGVSDTDSSYIAKTSGAKTQAVITIKEWNVGFSIESPLRAEKIRYNFTKTGPEASTVAMTDEDSLSFRGCLTPTIRITRVSEDEAKIIGDTFDYGKDKNYKADVVIGSYYYYVDRGVRTYCDKLTSLLNGDDVDTLKMLNEHEGALRTAAKKLHTLQ